MEDELRAHIQLRADDLEASGLTRVEAERRVRIEFGGYECVKEECLETAGGTLLESLVQDLKYAGRSLRRAVVRQKQIVVHGESGRVISHVSLSTSKSTEWPTAQVSVGCG